MSGTPIQRAVEAFINDLAERIAERVVARLGNNAALRPRLLNVDQAALYLSRTEDSVRHMQKTGKLPVVKIDGRVQFDVRELDRWLEQSNRQKQAPSADC